VRAAAKIRAQIAAAARAPHAVDGDAEQEREEDGVVEGVHA